MSVTPERIFSELLQRVAAAAFGRGRGTQRELEDSIERLGSELDLLATELRAATRSTARTARAQDGGIQPGDLLHVTPAGLAYRATAANASRYCTDWALSVTAGQVTLGGADARLNTLAPTSTTKPRLWLSLQAGKATDQEPRAADGAEIRQPVGVQTASYSGGKATARFQPEAEGEAW